MKTTEVDRLEVRIYENRSQLGVDAAKIASQQISQLLEEQNFVNIIFAAAPSQDDFLASLLNEKINWERINAFHMDEYLGLNNDAPQKFGRFLKDRLFDKVALHAVYYLDGNAANEGEECKRYTALLKANSPDIVCMGIGENTHIAFNDPHVADFNDPYWVKIVDLDEACKQQQVNDKCFDNISQVPALALTLTIPALLKAKYVLSIVPGKNKAGAIYHTLLDLINEQHPSTILRRHEHAILFLDKDSAAEVPFYKNQLN